MAVVARKRKGGLVYYAANRWQGRLVWERSGHDEREADRLDARIKKQIEAGTYVPRRTDRSRVDSVMASFFAGRNVRSQEYEEGLWRYHVVGRCPWFAATRMDDVRPDDVARLVRELAQPFEDPKTGKTRKLAPKTVANAFGVLKAMWRWAMRREIIGRDVCLLEPGTLKRAPKKPRGIYSGAAVRALLDDERIPIDRRVWNALAFWTGMREGEVCGRRWRDLDLDAAPLGCMTIQTQYQDEPLKTDKPRLAPIHPELAKVLAAFWTGGFELVYRRKPRLDDFIVPRRDDPTSAQTKSMAYKGWERSCREAGIQRQPPHEARHTFITTARRLGARVEVVEQITHNATGKMVDRYTHWEWAPLCEAVALVQYVSAPVRQAHSTAENWLQRQDSNHGPGRRYAAKGAKAQESAAVGGPAFRRGSDDRPPNVARVKRGRTVVGRLFNEAIDGAEAGDRRAATRPLRKVARSLSRQPSGNPG